MVMYYYVLIVFSFRRESLKLILATDPLPRWFCHSTPPHDRHRRHEPATVSLPSPFAPKLGSASTGLTPRPFSLWPTAASRSDSAGEPPATREFSPPLFLQSRAKMPSWAAWPSRPGCAVGWARVHNVFYYYLLAFHFFELIQINSEFD
jgi:hypothetical protein